MLDNIKTRPKNRAPEVLRVVVFNASKPLLKYDYQKYNINKQ